ncbi:carboxypeptidase regulatory-like domain-containing protein [Aeromicrobium massiliense]|uniref:carboxypeptidase regulatory-like domain-containing protein n=1 Tax=Aeromicrobium massiliense TaxID=1464554 RepID=UPI000A7A43B7|nr:carboxypeptidase regulatory-like domain-containing protein [Aeromicrobium massiliense]
MPALTPSHAVRLLVALVVAAATLALPATAVAAVPGLLTGTVVLADGSDPWEADASVDVRSGEDDLGAVWVGEDGSYELDLDPGSYTLVYAAPGFGTVERDVAVDGDAVLPTITLSAPVKVTGLVVRAGAGEVPLPFAGVELRAVKPGGGLGRPVTTSSDASGRFEATVAVGTYRVSYTAFGRIPVVVPSVQVDAARELAPVTMEMLPAPIENLERPSLQSVHVHGTATVSSGRWNYASLGIAYQWYLDGAPVAGATRATFPLQAKHRGHRLRASVTASGSHREPVVVFTEETVVAAALATLSAAPRVVGTTQVGQTLRAVLGRPTPSNATVTYQWTAGSVRVPETGPTVRLRPELRGKRLRLRVRVSAPGYSTNEYRVPATTVVKVGTIALRSAPTVSGSPKVGRTLRARVAVAAPSGVRVRYQWLANGKAIKGATKSTVRLTKAQRKRRISVQVSLSASAYAPRVVLSARTRAVR